jgi:hypothetical protein
MSPLFFILGILLTTNVSYNTPLSINTLPSILIQQDSTPPKNNVVKIKELTAPTKRKKKPKKNKKEEIAPSKNKSEKIADITKTKAYKANQRKKVQRAKKNKIVATSNKKDNKIAVSTKKKKVKVSNTKKLNAEEELNILAKTDNIEDIDKQHPNNNCTFAFDVTDEFTGSQKKGLFARTFFSYTPAKYQKFFKDEDFIRCEGFLSQSTGGLMALNINLYVASEEAKYKFGAIKANSTMVVHSMDGKQYFFMTYKGAAPKVIENITVYQCSFAIDKRDFKNLKKTEVDKIRIVFEKGIQSYDVFYLDFLIDQFSCFE